MCFTPKVSFATAFIEFFTAAWLCYRFPKSKLTAFFAVVLIFLATYQFSEFMLCVTGNTELWGKVGFIAYTFIPAILVLFTATPGKIKIKYLPYFIPAIIISAIAAFDKNFITYGVCHTLFVTIRNKFFSFDSNPIMTVLYCEYYFIYLAITTIYLYRKIKIAKNKQEKFIYRLMIATIPLVIVPPLILIVVLPAATVMFPSIYCHFAMIITLTAIISLYYENKYLTKE